MHGHTIVKIRVVHFLRSLQKLLLPMRWILSYSTRTW
jgi:hypothetical protein